MNKQIGVFENLASKTLSQNKGSPPKIEGNIPEKLFNREYNQLPSVHPKEDGYFPLQGPYLIDINDCEPDHKSIYKEGLTSHDMGSELGDIKTISVKSTNDTLAFYKTFRNKDMSPFTGKWGIFYFDFGIRAIGNLYCGYTKKRVTYKKRTEIGLKLLRLHELYHFKVDAWSLLMEASAKKHLYSRYKSKKKFLMSVAGGQYFEESLANRFVLQKLRTSEKNLKSFHEWFVSSFQPNLYQLNFNGVDSPAVFGGCPNNGSECLTCDILLCAEKEWKKGVAASEIFTAQIRGLGFPNSEQFPQHFISPHPASENIWGIEFCPEYVISNLGVPDAIGDGFQGPTRKELMRFLEKYLGAKHQRTTDHQHWRLDNGEIIKIPNPHSKDIFAWEFKSILKKAGMKIEEYRFERQKTSNWKKDCPRAAPRPSIT